MPSDLRNIVRIVVVPGSKGLKPIAFHRFEDGSISIRIYDRNFGLFETVSLTAEQAERLKEV